MKGRTLGIFLMVLFGATGLTILVLTWLRPLTLAERVLTTAIGSAGLFIASIKAWYFKSPPKVTEESLPEYEGYPTEKQEIHVR